MSDAASDASSPGANREHLIDGVGVAPGIAIGAVYHYQSVSPVISRAEIEPDEVEDELALLEEALQRAEHEIGQVQSVAQRTLGGEGAAIFEAQLMMLRDEALLGPVRDRIREEQASAAHALKMVLKAYRRRIEESEDAYLRSRTDDLVEVETRLLRALERGKTAARIEPNAIVVADSLTASDVIRFRQHGILGCVTTGGGVTSHVSILARALNLPAVVGAETATEVVDTHDRAVLDGLEGRLILHPSSETLDEYRERQTRYQSLQAKRARAASQPAVTTDGHAVTFRANVEFGEEVDVLGEYGADGIGLLRTEMLLLNRPSGSLSEDEQVGIYRRAAETTDSHGATVRLFDLGGETPLAQSHREPNPALGWRGVRLLLDRTDELLRPQVRALLRANAHGTLRALLPMVTHLDEVRRVRDVIRTEADRLADMDVEYDPELPVGAMVEVPAVALQAPAFAEATDFLSIGTNDLTQYVLAVDRTNDRVAGRYDALHPAVLNLVRRTAEAGRAADTPVALCGESASDVEAIPILIGLGVTILSASPTYLPTLKRLIRHIARADAQSLADAACRASDAETVRRRARQWLDEFVDVSLVDAPRSPDV